jgi:hypothetical protein
MTVSRCLCFVILAAAIMAAVLLSGCAGQQPGVRPVVPGTTPVIPGTTPVVTETAPVTTPSTLPPPPSPPTTTPTNFEVKINSLSCTWFVRTGDYGVKSDCVRVISSGTAKGPVGARLELPILAWSTDKFTCGAWTLKAGALIAVGSTCRREAGQPESTTWKVDTEGDECPLKSYFATSITHTVKIYKDDDLTPQKEANKRAVCQ